MSGVTVVHPIFPEVTHDVPKRDVSKWVDAGWLLPPARESRKATRKRASSPTEPKN